MSYDDLLKKDHITPEELLQDHRRSRTSKAPEGVVTGSPEYWKWWREQNVSRNKLYQKRAYLKRRKLTLAMQRKDNMDDATIEAALHEVDEQLASIREFRAADVAATRKAAALDPKRIDDPTATEFTDNDDNEIPFIRELTDMYPPLTYDEVFTAMQADDYRGESQLKEMADLKKAASKTE